MKVYSEILGNVHRDDFWSHRVHDCDIEYIDLDQWTAQKSRFVAHGSRGRDYAVALSRPTQLMNGDVLDYFPEEGTAAVIRIELSPVLVIDMSKLQNLSSIEMMRASVELGHALGNQHWPAVVREWHVYVPLTVDKTVMLSVMKTHHIEGITYSFQPGQEVLPFLAPDEVRRLFGGADRLQHDIATAPHDHHHTPFTHDASV